MPSINQINKRRVNNYLVNQDKYCEDNDYKEFLIMEIGMKNVRELYKDIKEYKVKPPPGGESFVKSMSFRSFMRLIGMPLPYNYNDDMPLPDKKKTRRK